MARLHPTHGLGGSRSIHTPRQTDCVLCSTASFRLLIRHRERLTNARWVVQALENRVLLLVLPSAETRIVPTARLEPPTGHDTGAIQTEWVISRSCELVRSFQAQG